MSNFPFYNARFGQYVDVVPVIDDLRKYPITKLKAGDVVAVGGDDVVGDGDGGFYIWVPTDTSADDGDRVVRPSSVRNTGRWLKAFGKGDVGAIGPVGPQGPIGNPSTVPGPQGPAGTITPEANAAKVAAEQAAIRSASSASTSQIAADAAQSSEDSAAGFAGAAAAIMANNIFPNTAAALAVVTTEGAPFLIQGAANSTTYATLFRRVGTDAVNQNLSIPSLAALTALQNAFSFQSIKAIPAGGNLPGGVPIASGGWLIPPADGAVIQATNGDQVRKGVKFAVKVAPGQGVAFRVAYDTRSVDIGMYVYGNVLITKANGAAYPVKSGTTEFLTLGNVPQNGGSQQGFPASTPEYLVKTEDVSANTRRFVVGGQLTTVGGPLNFTFVYVQNTTATEIQVSGFGVAVAPSKASDIDYTDYDPINTTLITGRVDALAAQIAGIDTSAKNIIEPIPAGGDLPGGQPKYNGSWLVAPAPTDIAVATDATTKRYGAKFEHRIPSGDGSYFRIDLPAGQFVANGDYAMGSVIIRKKTSDSWASIDPTAEIFTVSTVPTDNGTQQALSVTNGAVRTFEDITANVRRYKITAQLTQLSSPLSWVILFPHAFPFEVWASSFAFGTDHKAITDIRNWDFDFARSAEYNTRITNIESIVSTTTPQPTPQLLVPSSLPVIQGQPMYMYRSRMTELGTGTAYKFANIGRGGRLESVMWDDGKQLAFDGARLSGAGYIVANNATGTFRRPVNFRSSPAVKTGNPVYRLLTIGDSLSQQGQTSILEAKLVSAGVPVTMLGTFKDTGGSWGETRGSWAALTYTNAQTSVNSDGSGAISPVSDTAEYLSRPTPFGTPNDDYGPRWGSNPFIRPSRAGDPTADIKNGYIFDFAFYLNRFNFPVPTSVDINLLMNDFLRGFDIAQSMASIDIMVRSIRSVSANINISFGVFGIQSEGSQLGILNFIKAVLATYGNREAERFWVLPLWEMADPEIGYTMSATGNPNAYGVEQVSVSDGIHPPRSGPSHAEWAQLRFAHHMNLIA